MSEEFKIGDKVEFLDEGIYPHHGKITHIQENEKVAIVDYVVRECFKFCDLKKTGETR